MPGETMRGFTLIELMITMVIGMVILTGVTSTFVHNSRMATMLADRTERMGDLYTVSHVMQRELRAAQGALTTLTQGATTVIDYYTAGSNCHGFFEYRPIPNSQPPDYEIRWKRAEKTTTNTCNQGVAQQLMRGLDPVNGMLVTPLGANPYANAFLGIDLYAMYNDTDKQSRTVSLSFKVWSRN